jgi:maleylacetoacetate isomerase
VTFFRLMISWILWCVQQPLGQDEEAMTHWYKHRLSLGFEGVENVLIQDPRSCTFCHGDTPGSRETWRFSEVFNAWRHHLNKSTYLTIGRGGDVCEALEAYVAARTRRQPNAQ